MRERKSYRLREELVKIYDLSLGKQIKYMEKGDEAREHTYEIVGLYPHCIQLRDIDSGQMKRPGYNMFDLMMRGLA